MGRELRKVPANWEHPKDDDGRYVPMFDIYYGDALRKWLDGNKKWDNGTHPDLIEDPKRKEDYPFFAMWEPFPEPKYYHTKKYTEDGLTHIQLYETTSEGTPKSPVFPKEDFDKLCEYAAEHVTTFAHFRATKDEWKEMLSSGFVYHKSGNVIFI